jgi:hypothetical protein
MYTLSKNPVHKTPSHGPCSPYIENNSYSQHTAAVEIIYVNKASEEYPNKCYRGLYMFIVYRETGIEVWKTFLLSFSKNGRKSGYGFVIYLRERCAIIAYAGH